MEEVCKTLVAENTVAWVQSAEIIQANGKFYLFVASHGSHKVQRAQGSLIQVKQAYSCLFGSKTKKVKWVEKNV